VLLRHAVPQRLFICPAALPACKCCSCPQVHPLTWSIDCFPPCTSIPLSNKVSRLLADTTI
jgi:hypothetical protein